jgi:hypothetical protein
MINLGYKTKPMEACSPCEPQKDNHVERYPVLQIGSVYGDSEKVELPLDADSIGNIIECNVKLRISGIEERVINGKSACSYTFDVMGIEMPEAETDDAKGYVARRKSRMRG